KDAGTLDTRRGFAQLGMDSLMALALQKRLEESLGVALPATVAFEYPTVEKLATFLFTDILQPGTAVERQAVSVNEVAHGSRSASPTFAGCLPGSAAIAIVGLGCRFPGANDPAAFWQLLRAGVDMVGEMPAERWGGEIDDALADGVPGRGYVRQGAFV